MAKDKELDEVSEQEDVILKKDDYTFLIDSVKSLTEKVTDLQNKTSGVIDLEYVDKHFAHVRFYDGKMVRSHTKCWNAPDPEDKDRKVPWIGAIVEGEKEPVKMTLNEFMENLQKEKVEIVDRILVDKGERVVGTTDVIKYDYDKYRAINTGIRVAQKVVTPVYNIKIRFADGREDVLPEEGVIGQ